MEGRTNNKSTEITTEIIVEVTPEELQEMISKLPENTVISVTIGGDSDDN